MNHQPSILPPPGSPPSREAVWRMFDVIAPRYDLLNRLLSLRQDVVWRRRMADHLPPGQSLRHLDIATGTGDQIIAILGKSGSVAEAVGVDMSEGMLAAGQKKFTEKTRADGRAVTLQIGDATKLPFHDARFDVTTISFGIRNVVDVPRALREMHRVLRPGGRALILEFSLPEARVMRSLYLFYLRHVLPRLGGALSGHADAYRSSTRPSRAFRTARRFAG